MSAPADLVSPPVVLGDANPWNRSIRYGETARTAKAYALALFPCDDNYAGDGVETRRVMVLEHWEGWATSCIEVDRFGAPERRDDAAHVLPVARLVFVREVAGKRSVSAAELATKRRAYASLLSRPAVAPERPEKMPVTTAPAATA